MALVHIFKIFPNNMTPTSTSKHSGVTRTYHLYTLYAHSILKQKTCTPTTFLLVNQSQTVFAEPRKNSCRSSFFQIFDISIIS